MEFKILLYILLFIINRCYSYYAKTIPNQLYYYNDVLTVVVAVQYIRKKVLNDIYF